MKRLFSIILSLAMIIALVVIPVNANAVTASSRVSQILSSMSLRQKITQMLMPDFRYWDINGDGSVNSDTEMFTQMTDDVRQIIEDYDFGAVIYFAQNLTGTEQSYYLTMEMQKAATKDGGIPMLIAADQEGGMVYRLGTGTALPGNMALGAATDPSYAKMAGEIIGRELSSLGINTNLAPVVDVNNNPNNPVIGLRSYSDNPDLVGNLASATIAGLRESNVIGCAKHFPGHGDTETDSHYGLPSVDKSLSVLKECELKPYEIAIEQGIDMIMTAHILYPQLESDTAYSNKTAKNESLPATMSDDILTDLLKGDMGFEGVVITDAMNMEGIANNWDNVQACVLAIQAGVDMICMPVSMRTSADLSTLESIISGIQTAVNNGTIPMSRINDAVTRILTVKENRGILDWNEEDYTAGFASYMVGSELNRQAEREIAAAAVTVVQNKNNVLPLNVTSSTKVVVYVPYEDEKAQIAMAWNRAKIAGVVPDGATLNVVQYSSSGADTSAISSANIVIVNSEVSASSKMNGATWASAVPMSIVSTAENAGKTTVVMSSDKPYDVQCYTNADAVLAVYGCKGSSVDPTEALTGSVTSSEAAYGPNIIAGMEVMLGVFGAQGKLPLDIPSYNGSTYTNSVLYAKGTGITYNAKHVHNLTLVEERDAIAQEGYNRSFYQCTGCGMWFEDSNGKTVIKDKFSLVDDVRTDLEVNIEETASFWLTHYNTLANEGAGTVISTSGFSGGAWNDSYAFEPVLGTDAYKLVAISRGYTNGGTGVLPAVPKGGFVYSLNRGNSPYYSDNCDNMIARAQEWEIGDLFVFDGIDLSTFSVPTTTSGTNWYNSSYVCTATYSKVTIEDPVPDHSDVLQFASANLTITDDIAVNYKVSNATITENAYSNPYVVFEMNGKETTVTEYSVIDGNLVFDYENVAPHQMDDEITATLYATKEDKVCIGETFNYSIKEYCYNTLDRYNTNEYSELRTLIVDLLNYGAKSQEYMNYKTNSYVNSDLTAIQKSWGTASDRELNTVLDTDYATVANPTVIWKAAGLNLKQSVGMRFRFDAESLDGLTVKVTSGGDEWILGEENFETTVNGNYVFFEGMSVAQMSEAVYVTAYKENTAVSDTLCYSIESYAYAKQNNEDNVLVELVKAMIRYGDSAKAYIE